MDNLKLLIAACAVGFMGDAMLQLGIKFGADWGLKDYFNQHGSLEALFIAGGMMVLFYAIYILLKLPLNYIAIAVYAVILDLLWRKFNIFPSLKGYYDYFNIFWSGLWEIIAMWLPLILVKFI
jgi:hypothetical protein